MGFKSLVNKLATVAVDATGDIPERIAYYNVRSPGTYDVATDVFSNEDADVYVDVPAVPIRPREDQDDYQSIQDDSTKMLIAREHMPGFVEKSWTVNDYIEWGGVTYEVSKIQSIPSAAIFYIWVRRP